MISGFKNISELEGIAKKTDFAETRPIYISDKPVDSYIAVWNTTKNNLETIVEKKNSGLIQHKDALSMFVDTAKEQGKPLHGNFKNYGGEVIAEIIFDDLKIKDSSGSNVSLGTRLRNNYSSHAPSFSGSAFGFRSFCSNGMVLGKVLVSNFSTRHTKISDLEKLMGRFIDRIYDSASTLETVIQEADNDNFSEMREMDEYLQAQFLPRKLIETVMDELEDRKEHELSRYTLYNGLTSYATKHAKSESMQGIVQTVAQTVLTEPTSKLLERVVRNRERRNENRAQTS